MNTGICFGILFSNFIAAIILPNSEASLEELEEDTNWRFVFAASIFI